MFAIKGVYEGESIRLLDPVPVQEDYDLIIIFTQPRQKKSARETFPYFPVKTAGYVFDREEANER